MASRSLFGGLRGRLAAAIAAILVIAGALAFVAVYRGTGQQLRAQIDRELLTDLRAFLDGAVPANGTPAAVRAAGVRYVSNRPFPAASRLLVERVSGAGIVTNQPELLGLARDRDESETRQQTENAQARALVQAPEGYSTVDVPDVGEVRLLTRKAQAGARTVATVSTGESLEPARRAQRSVAHTFAITGSLTLLAGLVASLLVAGRLTRPLRQMADVAARIDGGDLSPRFHSSKARDEVRILADTFDHMLDRLEQAFRRQHAFVSDASHELRTPLTVVRGQLEVLARHPHPSPEDVRRVEALVRTELARMERLVDELLVLARADESDFVHPRDVSLAPFLEELARGIVPTADRRFEFGTPPAGTLHVDPDRLAQALRNLLVNAIEHTRAGDRISLAVAARDGRVTFAVDDSGPGIPPQERALVFDRFHRAGGSRARSGSGAGLGLAIVQAVAEAHGGTVAASDSPLGGARLVLTLPGFR